MSKSGGVKAGLLAVGLGLMVEAVGAQSTAPSFTATLSADTVQMGEIFELAVSVPVPAGTIVYFPDTLPATIYVESAGPVRVTSESRPGEGSRLLLTYDMMAFGVGELPVPGFDILMRARGEQGGVLELPDGSATGIWDQAPRQAGSRITRIPRQGVWVTPVFTAEQIAEGVEPMPANDVAGGSWSWPSLTLMLMCGSLLAVTLVSTTRGLLDQSAARRGAARPPTPEELRAQTLADLDALLAKGLHTDGRMLDFYTRGSTIVRRFVEQAEGPWPSSLTSTELMGELVGRAGDDAVGSLPAEMGLAEVVKFGRLRPDADTAEKHWRVLHGWVEGPGARS